jgi:rubrerythrin
MSARRLEELRRGFPADATLQNLLTVVSGQLQLCARLPVYEYEAAHEAQEESAAAFRALAVAEQSHVEELLVALRHHLAAREARAAAERAPDPMTTREGAPR